MEEGREGEGERNNKHTQSISVRVSVGVYPRVSLKKVNDIVDELIDLSLVGARDEVWVVVDAGELEISA